MARLIIAMTATLLLAMQSHASTVLLKSYVYRYESVRDVADYRQFVICENRPRIPLVPELSPPPIAVRFETDPAKPPESPKETQVPEASSSLPDPKITLEKTIHFAFDSAKVRDRQGVTLLARSLKSDPALIGVRVVGFTCDLGSKTHNDRLALRRAEAVAEILGEEGFRVVEIAGEGKCCYAPGARRHSRRAEISVLRSPGKDESDEK
ncbi:MAG: OmpA family protein [Geobacteraceae bacterium]|nr:OmpA family protein [Geobacteraceae bacterium]